MSFVDGPIEGVLFRDLSKFVDQRGWLVEIYRNDETPQEYWPVMMYVSETLPGVARGPHEHVDQADLFGFIGPSTFKLYLWDNRPKSPTYKNRMTRSMGIDAPATVIIPPGVVHAYKNIGPSAGWVMNCANRLYRGEGRKSPVDEIRHEEDTGSIFVLD